ncbi:MAG: hypothetical protein Q8P97_00205 [bacterium]|nr:hypothetical protein [bacterium]
MGRKALFSFLYNSQRCYQHGNFLQPALRTVAQAYGGARPELPAVGEARQGRQRVEQFTMCYD